MAGNDSGCKEKMGEALSMVVRLWSQREGVWSIYSREKAG
jgi:hypothetical protein